jgi:hypothetical protein
VAGGARVGVAFSDSTLTAAPTWTYITDEPNLVAGFTIDRGRQYELDVTDIGRASVAINDQDGILDPTNSLGPYYGSIDKFLQVILDLWNPVTSTWSTLFRGYIDETDYVFDPSQRVNQLTMSLVDAFSLLTGIEMQADGSFGDVVPAASAGNIFFDNANVDDRILQVLGNAGWPTALSTVFSGNVSLQESVYAPGDTVLQVVQDAADAEFPGLGNVYVSKGGIVTFHGRLAKFDPVTVAAGAGGAWTFTQWKCGDVAAVGASISDTAQLREFSFNRGLSRVINYATAMPQGIAEDATVRAAQTVLDSVSIGERGYHIWSKENLLVAAGTTTGNNANDECKLYAQYYVDNYAIPRNRVTNIAFRSMSPQDPRAAANWELLCGAEISDQLAITVGSPGGGGFNAEPEFFEGIHYEVKPGNGEYADVTMRPDLSPAAYFLSSPF